MSENPAIYQGNGSNVVPLPQIDANTRRGIKAARTRRLRRRMEPFDQLDAEVVQVIERLLPPGDEKLGANTARAILQAQTLRKELLLGKLKAEELERRVEALDVKEEWEKVNVALGII